MNFKDDVNKIMKHIQVDDEMTNEILNQTTRKEKKHLFGKKRTVALIMAAVLCVGSVAVAANEVTGFWNNMVDRFLQADEEEKTELVEKGYIDNARGDKVSDTADGITISLLQTVAGKNDLYIYLKVESEKAELSEGMFPNFLRVYIEGEERGVEKSVGFIPNSKHEGIMEIHAASDIGKDSLEIAEKKIDVKIGDLQFTATGKVSSKVDYEKLSKASWNLSWTGKSSTDSKEVKLNGKITQNGLETELKRMEITPLSVTFEYDSDWNAMEEPEWIEIPFTIVMKDGTTFTLREDGSDERGAEQNGSVTKINFAKVLNIYNIDYVEVAGTRYEVD